MNRNDTIREIKAALKIRSGKTWSATGGKGTAYGWIDIASPPARRTAHSVKKDGALSDWPADYEIVDTGAPGGYMTDADRAELGALLGLPGPVHRQGEQVPASSEYYSEYLDRAKGVAPKVIGKVYWD